jgi:hypothetical protein
VADPRVYVTERAGVWHILAEPGVREKTRCGRYPPIWPAPWPHRTEDAGRVSEDDVCRLCLRVVRRRTG